MAARVGVVCVLVAILVRCDGDGPSGPTVLEVGGSWIEVSTLVDDGCELDFSPTVTTNVTIIPSGNQITFVFHAQGGDVPVTGSFDSRTGDFSLPITLQAGNQILTIVQVGRFSSNSRYTSETTITITEGAFSCTTTTTEVGQRNS